MNKNLLNNIQMDRYLPNDDIILYQRRNPYIISAFDVIMWDDITDVLMHERKNK